MELALCLKLGDGLLRELTTTPLVHLFLVVVEEAGVDGVDDLGHLGAVFWLDLGEGDAGAGLHANDLAEAALALDDAVWDLKLAAESWEPDDELEWVDIVGDDNKASLLGLNSSGNVLDTLDEDLLGGGIGDLEGGISLLGLSLDALLLLGLVLWAILLKEFENLDSVSLVKGVVEVVHWWWDLQALHEDAALALDADVSWELDGSSLVSDGGLGLLLEEELLADDVLVFDVLLSNGTSSLARHEQKEQPANPLNFQSFQNIAKTVDFNRCNLARRLL